jgi:hypothetical protein
MTSRKARVVAKAAAVNREQEIRRIFGLTVVCAVALVLATVVSLVL